MKAIVLAGGKGTRLMSETFNLPKVLRQVCGKPLIGYVLESLSHIDKSDIVIVVGYMGEKVMEYAGAEFSYATQREQKGTGHAVMSAESALEGYDGDVLILYGDMPLFKAETYREICEKHASGGADLTLLTSVIDNPPAYGRIIRDDSGNIVDIVEQKDATEEQKKITELNVGVNVIKSSVLFDGLKKIRNDNAQGEYYLTDLPKVLIAEGKKVDSLTTYDADEIMGVNTPEDLQYCEGILKNRKS